MNRLTAMALVGLLISGMSSSIWCSQPSDEIKTIASAFSSDWQPTSVFWVHVFTGFVPIPNRYQLNFESKSHVYNVQFFSPSSVLAKVNLSVSDVPMGDIAIGKFSELPKGKSLTSGKPNSAFDCYGLTIEIRDFPVKGRHSVLIKQADSYITIADSNDDLWKAMLAAYGTSVGQSNSCPQIADIDAVSGTH